MRSAEVRRILGITPVELKELRTTEVLLYYSVAGMIFYKHEDVMKQLAEMKRQKRKQRRVNSQLKLKNNKVNNGN